MAKAMSLILYKKKLFIYALMKYMKKLNCQVNDDFMIKSVRMCNVRAEMKLV